MNHYVLVFSVSRRALLRPIEVFDEAHRRDALSRRFELEREYPGEHVASLGANGPDHLRASFGRYFVRGPGAFEPGGTDR